MVSIQRGELILLLDCHLLSQKCICNSSTESNKRVVGYRSHSITWRLPHPLNQNQDISKSSTWPAQLLISDRLLTNITVCVHAKRPNCSAVQEKEGEVGRTSIKSSGCTYGATLTERLQTDGSCVNLRGRSPKHFAKE